MNEPPLVSLIIPIYNVELYIEKCLLSVLNQTYQNIEIILVDDCGQDNSLAIAKQTAKNHPNGYKVTILEQEYNQGPSVARNRGTEYASGKYIYFLDSDDEITIDCIEILISSCDSDEIVIGSFSSEGKENQPNEKKRYLGKDILDAFFQEKINLYACNKLLLKNFIISNNLYFPKMLHEDFIWTYRIIAHASSINLIPDITYKYTLRNDSRTGAMSSKNIYALIESIDYIEKDISKKGINNHAIIYIINTWWSIKSQASKVLAYTDFKELQFKNEKLSVKKISRNSRIKYYILKSSAKIQYILLRLYYELKKG